MSEPAQQVPIYRPFREWLSRRWLYWRTLDFLRLQVAFRIAMWLKDEKPGGNRWRNGLHACMWTFYCGYDVRFAVKMGCIYWLPRWMRSRSVAKSYRHGSDVR